MKRTTICLTAAAATLFLVTSFVQAGTLEEVKKRGELICGVSTGIPGFSNPDEKRGLDWF